MRKIVMTCAAAAALFVAAAFTPLAQAMTSAVPVDLVKAAAGANLTENVGYICHWRFRQCWWFPPYYLPYAAYGYYRPYRHWHHWRY